MEQSQDALNVQPEPVGQTSKRILAVIFLIVAALFIFNGLFILSSNSDVVGSDAFNYIISAGRGTGKICVGIFFALISVILAIFDLGDRQHIELKR